MKEVVVYSLVSERAVVFEGQKELTYYDVQEVSPTYPIGAGAPTEAFCTLSHIPIECWVENGQEYYLAFKPELGKILESKYAAKYKTQLDTQTRLLKLERSCREGMQSRITEFKSLPWYLRIWKALLKEV